MNETKEVATAQPTGLAVRTLDDVMKFSNLLAGSKLIPSHLQGKPSDVAIILLKGNELDLAPMQALDSIDVIQGKPSLKPEAQLGMIYSKFPDAVINIESDHKAVSVKVSAVRPGNPTPQVFVWDMARARQMGLDQKDNYKKQPLVMLKWRAVGEMARSVFPDVTRGLKNTEEAEDWANESGEDKGSRVSAALSEDPKPEPKEVESEVLSPRAERAKAELDKTKAIIEATAAVKPVAPEPPKFEAPAEGDLQPGMFDSFSGTGPLLDDDADPVIRVGKDWIGKRMSQVPPETLASAFKAYKQLSGVQPLTPEQTAFLADYQFFVNNRGDRAL